MANDSGSTSQTKRLGEMLLEDGVVSEGQLSEALEIKQAEGGFIGKILIDMKYLDEHTLINYLVKQLKIPHISLLDYEIASDVIQLVPEEVCLQYNLLPIDKLGKILTVAMVDPLDAEALDKVRESVPDVRIKPILCSWQHFEHVARASYPEHFEEKEKAALADAPPPGEMSMESLGLSSKPAKGKKPAPEAAKSSAKDSDAGSDMPAVRAPATAKEIMGLIDVTIQSAMDEAVVHLATSIREFVQAAEGDLPVSSVELAERVRKAIGESAEIAGSSIVQETKKAIEEVGTSASDLTALELAQIVDACVRRGLAGISKDVIEGAAQSLASKAK